MPGQYDLLGLGNPLLDISVNVDDAFLQKYGLKKNDTVLVENDNHRAVYGEVLDKTKFTPDFVAGGSCQNAMRGAQWLLPPNSTVYIGCVGKDETADLLREAAAKDGLRTEYLIDESTPTGRCAVLINDIHRSMVTDLLAANNYKISHALSEPINAFIEQAKFYYVEGYHLTVSPDTILHIAKHAAHNDKKFSLNLSAPFIPSFFTKPLDEVLAFTDYLFGNEDEALAFAKSHDFETTDVAEIAKKISEIPHGTGHSRIVVITQGARPTVVVHKGIIETFPVIPISVEDIVDTNGAGDAFCGGFLSQLVQGKTTKESVAAGNYVANIVIQRVGPTYPREAPKFVYEG